MGRHHVRNATVAVLGTVLVVAAACTPTPTPPTGPVDPAPPEIHDVRLVTPRTEAPVTATLRWRISDPNGDALTCRIDLDGDLVGVRLPRTNGGLPPGRGYLVTDGQVELVQVVR